MSNKEQLSALMDGEAIDLSLIKAIEQDSESFQSWKNFHLISDTLKGEAPAEPNWDISLNVAAALEAEPSYSKLDDSIVPDNVQDLKESQPTPQKARKHLPAWLTQLSQVGVAACVSLMVIFGVQQYSGQDGADADADAVPVLQTIPFSGAAEPVSLTRESVRAQSEEAKQLDESRQINALMQDYQMQLRLNHSQSNLDNENHIQESIK